MRKKTAHRLHLISLLFANLLFGWCITVAESLAATNQASEYRQEMPHPTSPALEAPQAAYSPLWHSFLWEALPVDWIQNSKNDVILEAYQANGWKPFFIDSQFELTPGAKALMQRLQTLESEAIDPAPYRLEELTQRMAELEQTQFRVRSVDPNFQQSLARLNQTASLNDSSSSLNLPRGASPSLGGSPMRPPDLIARKEMVLGHRDIFRQASAVDVLLAGKLVRFANEMDPFSKDRQLQALTGKLPTTEFLQSLAPPSPHYLPLRATLGRYRLLAHKSAHKSLAGPTLRPGERGSRVRLLQERLQQEGFYSGEVHGSFDQATREGVRNFQIMHLLQPDGVVGPQTQAMLNVSYQEKVNFIVQSMRLLRQSQSRLYQHYVRINIPQFTLEYYRDGKLAAVHRIIVGKATGKKVKMQGRWIGINQTPTLISNLRQVILNPRWYVSDRIRLELDDEAAEDPYYFARHGYVEMSSAYPWGQPRLYQRPGPTNPLGRVKFEFSNPYAVFLHDTPKKHLFNRYRRDFSHGCIRLEGALDFARMLLADDQNDALDKVENYLQSNRQTFIRLNQSIPIIIEYLPVSSNGQGQAVFCGDPYKWFAEDSSKRT